MVGVITFVIPMGIQTVLFPWLIAVELAKSAERLGFAQMSTQLPGLCLILFGGVLADRIDPRKILIAVHCIAALPALALVLLLSAGQLSYAVMICYAILMGTVTAFAQPARDGMLNRIADGALQRAVIIIMGLTFGAQIFGIMAAGMAGDIGPIPLLIGQSTIFLTGAFAAFKLWPANSPNSPQDSHPVADIKDGLSVVFRSERMRSVMILLTFMSMFFGGTFMVLNPIIVRDVYQGSAFEISLSFAVFMCGTIAMTVILVSIGGLKNQGRGLLLALCFGGLILSIAAIGLPFWGYLLILFLWGISGGVGLSMGRTIMQEEAPESHRARVMSVFSLANLGGMPIGAVLLGYCASGLGPLNSLFVAVAGIWIASLLVFLTTNLAISENTKTEGSV